MVAELDAGRQAVPVGEVGELPPQAQTHESKATVRLAMANARLGNTPSLD
jgi:hypothetical protein